MSDLHSLTLSRLSRSARWAESTRSNGQVVLVGVGRTRMASLTVDEGVLRDLLADGSVVCDASTRLVDNPNSLRKSVQEVIVKYYSVVNKE